MAALDQNTIKRVKSIRELEDFQPEKMNVLVGANGAGKSKLGGFFWVLPAVAEGGLQSFVTNSGGADGFFFNGPKETKQLKAHLKFGSNQYRFALEPTVSGEMMIREEATLYTEGQMPSDWHTYGGGMTESRLKSWKD